MSQYDLNNYIQNWSGNYETQFQALGIFNFQIINNWDKIQIETFILQFYHVRGHFYKMLWFLGSTAPNLEYKKIILENIEEEFGGKSVSHEQLYFKFAKEFEVNIIEEILNPKFNVRFIQDFNQNHLKFVLKQPWPAVWSAVCAYEALDNIDYKNLYTLAQTIGTSKSGLGFFRIHMVAQHFEHASILLQEIWDKDQNAVKVAFEFIAENQLEMFVELDRQVNSLRSSISQESNIN